MTDRWLDLSPLDPDDDPNHEERFVRGVMTRVAEESDPIAAISALAPGVLAAAVVVICVAGALALATRQRVDAAPVSVAESIGIPRVFAEQMAAGSSAGTTLDRLHDSAGRRR